MARSNFIANGLEYGRELLHAGMNGVRTGEHLAMASNTERHIANSARQALKAAAVGGALSFLACKLIDRRRTRLAPIVACSSAAFCADFIWRTRNITTRVIECAEKEISRVRDQHWLDSHPIDYA